MIGFRVDANSEIGTGHLMRCLAIADKLKDFGHRIHFFTVDRVNVDIIQEKGFECHVLNGKYTDVEQDLLQLLVVLEKCDIKVLVVDSYFVTHKYLSAIKEKVKVVYIDDLHEMIYPCDVLVNYTIFANRINYEQMYKGTGTKLLLGCQYVPLRSEFENGVQLEVHDQIKKILVLSGGTDSYHFMLNFVKEIVACELYRHIIFQVVCGKYNMDKEMIKKMRAELDNLEVYENLSNLRDYMIAADVAISAAGTTLYELSACKTPTIGYTLADNQVENLQVFCEEGYVQSVGDIRNGFPAKEIMLGIKQLSDLKTRKGIQVKMGELVDGNGTKRLADEIIKLLDVNVAI